MDNFLVLLVLFGLAAAYSTKVLLFDTEKIESHYGPFLDYSRFISFIDHNRPVTLFDWIRRPFGVYNIQGKQWVVDEKLNRKIDRWTCPYCLSFWLSLVWAFVMHIVMCLIFDASIKTFVLYPVSVVALSAIASGIVVKVFD